MRGNTGCPVCAGLKVVPGINDLATKCPKIFAMWSAKNTYTPGEVSAGSNKKAWFVCPDCKQEFEASICNVVHTVQNGSTGCPVCAGRKVVPGINDLATQCPKVVPLWSDKNDYTPSEISARSERRAIFVCPDCKKEFVTSVRAMTRAIASGATCCPDCKMRMRTISAACKDEHDYAKSVGTTMTMKNGSKATCIAYHGVNNITVKFRRRICFVSCSLEPICPWCPSPQPEKHQRITEKLSDTQLAFCLEKSEISVDSACERHRIIIVPKIPVSLPV